MNFPCFFIKIVPWISLIILISRWVTTLTTIAAYLYQVIIMEESALWQWGALFQVINFSLPSLLQLGEILKNNS